MMSSPLVIALSLMLSSPVMAQSPTDSAQAQEERTRSSFRLITQSQTESVQGQGERTRAGMRFSDDADLSAAEAEAFRLFRSWTPTVSDRLSSLFTSLLEDSDLVVLASVEEIQEAGDWLREEGLPEDAEPYREATALVDEVWKGEWTTRVTFRASPLHASDLSGARVDERVLLFLDGDGEAAYALALGGVGRQMVLEREGGEVVFVNSRSSHDTPFEVGLAACRERVHELVAALDD